MVRDAVITYQGKPCTSVNFSRALGTTPDIGTVVMNAAKWASFLLNREREAEKLGQPSYYRTYLTELEKDPFVKDEGDVIPLRFDQFGDLEILVRDTQQKITFNYTYIGKGGIKTRKQSEEEKEKGIIPTQFEIEICDERRLWQDRGIFKGDYNMVDPNGIKIGDNYYRPDTVNGEELWSFTQLVEMIVPTLPSPRAAAYSIHKWNVASMSALGNLKPLNFECQGGRIAAEALGELLDRYGMYVSLLITPGKYGIGQQETEQDKERGDVIVIVERGQTEGLQWEESFEDAGLIQLKRLKLQPVYRPFGVVVTSDEKIIKETTVEDFTAVYQDPETKKWLDLEGNLDEIGIDIVELRRQALLGMSEKEKGFLSIKDKTMRAQMQQQAYKCWRMNLEDPTVLPMLNERILAVDDAGKPSDKGPIVVAVEYFYPEENKDPSAALWGDAFGELPGNQKPTFDLKAGVIRFPQPVGTLESRVTEKGQSEEKPEARPEDEDTARKMELLKNTLEKLGAQADGEKFGLDKAGGILDPVIEALRTGKDPTIPLEGVTSNPDGLIAAVNDYLSAGAGSPAEDSAREKIRNQLGALFKANSAAPSQMKQYADSWRKVAGGPGPSEPLAGLFNLQEAELKPGRIRATFQYVSDEYWTYEIRNPAWPLHSGLLEMKVQPIDTDEVSNISTLDAAAKDQALEKFKGDDEKRSYEVHVAGFWPMVADGDRPRVMWQVDADSDFKPRTTYLWDDFVGELGGRPGIGEKEKVRRTLETRARIP
jgi:hypothetical protein